jgi:hypothetical protein
MRYAIKVKNENELLYSTRLLFDAKEDTKPAKLRGELIIEFTFPEVLSSRYTDYATALISRPAELDRDTRY